MNLDLNYKKSYINAFIISTFLLYILIPISLLVGKYISLGLSALFMYGFARKNLIRPFFKITPSLILLIIIVAFHTLTSSNALIEIIYSLELIFLITFIQIYLLKPFVFSHLELPKLTTNKYYPLIFTSIFLFLQVSPFSERFNPVLNYNENAM